LPASSTNTDTLARLSKEIVGEVYSEILARIDSNLEVYKTEFESRGSTSNYMSSEIKRYKMLQRYILFLQKNNAYSKTVLRSLIRSIDDGSLSLFLLTGHNSQGS
jgi:hypothetical protein